MYDEMNKWMTLLVSVAYLHDLHIEKTGKVSGVFAMIIGKVPHFA